MATARGITDTKLYDHAGRHRALRHPARADPRLLRAQGRHVGQHPGRPGHRRQDRRRPAAALRRPRDGARHRRRDLRRQAQAEPRPSTPTTRASPSSWRRSSATSPVDVDLDARGRRASPTARGCARSSASSSCATRCGASRRRSATADAARAGARRRGAPSGARRARARSPTSRALPAAREVALRVQRARDARGRAVRRGADAALRRRGGERGARRRRATRPEELVARAAASGRSSPTTPSRSARVPPQPRPRHAARRLPARARAARLPVPRARARSAAWPTDVEDPPAADAVLVARARRLAARAASTSAG